MRSHLRIKTLLALLITVGGVSSVTVSGTYALLSAQETNGSSTISTGTLTLGNTVNAGTTCFSYGSGSSGNVNNACSPLMTSSTLQYPGGAPATAQVEIKNNGSINASRLTVYMPSCVMGTSPTAAGHANGGNPCVELFTGGTTPAGLVLTIEETTAAWASPKCVYPVALAAACTTDPAWAADSGNSFGIFAQYVTTSGSSIDLGSGPKIDQTRYFKVGVSLPATATNTLQGQMATFALTWHLQT
jgi:hypothetical protein